MISQWFLVDVWQFPPQIYKGVPAEKFITAMFINQKCQNIFWLLACTGYIDIALILYSLKCLNTFGSLRIQGSYYIQYREGWWTEKWMYQVKMTLIVTHQWNSLRSNITSWLGCEQTIIIINLAISADGCRMMQLMCEKSTFAPNSKWWIRICSLIFWLVQWPLHHIRCRVRLFFNYRSSWLKI